MSLTKQQLIELKRLEIQDIVDDLKEKRVALSNLERDIEDLYADQDTAEIELKEMLENA